MILGTFLAMGLAAAWVLTKAGWQAIAAEDPGKQLAEEIFQDVRARISWIGSNGSRNGKGVDESISDTHTEDIGGDRPPTDI
jgi:hypothetical protein